MAVKYKVADFVLFFTAQDLLRKSFSALITLYFTQYIIWLGFFIITQENIKTTKSEYQKFV